MSSSLPYFDNIHHIPENLFFDDSLFKFSFSRSLILFHSFPLFRPPSPPVDLIHEKYVNTDKLAEDFSIALRGCELADVMFIVGEDRIPLYGVKAILACRSRLVDD